MNCEEARAQLPDDAPEVAEHLAHCAECRAMQDAYLEDGEALAAGLRELAGAPQLDASILRPRGASRRFLPLAAAAAVVLTVAGALLFSPAPHAPDALPTNPDLFSTPGLTVPAQLLILQSGSDLQMIAARKAVWGQVLSIDTRAGRVSVSIGGDDVTAPDQEFVLYRQTERGYLNIGTLTLDRVGDSLSHGEVVNPRLSPRVGDFVVPARFLSHAEKAALLEFLFSYRPITDEDRERVRALTEKRDARALAAMGGVAAALVDEIPLVDGMLDEVAPVWWLVHGASLERNVEFLARLDDPRAYPRLKRILAAVRPFSGEEPPSTGPELAERLHAWWVKEKHRVRWSPEADRYEAR